MPCNLFSWYYKSKFFIFVLLFKTNSCAVLFTYFNFCYCFNSIFRRYCFCIHIIPFILIRFCWGRGRDRMVVGFTTTCAITVYEHKRCEFEPPSWRDVLDTTLCDEVCQWLAASLWFSLGTPISSTNKTDRHDITKILLKVASSTISRIYDTSGRISLTRNIITRNELHVHWLIYFEKCFALFNQNGILALNCAGKHEKKPLIHSLRNISFNEWTPHLHSIYTMKKKRLLEKL